MGRKPTLGGSRQTRRKRFSAKGQLSMKGSFAQVIKPLSEQVVRPYIRSWQYWGRVTSEYKTVRKNGDLLGFYIDVMTTKGTFRHSFKREEDPDGFFRWTETTIEEI